MAKLPKKPESGMEEITSVETEVKDPEQAMAELPEEKTTEAQPEAVQTEQKAQQLMYVGPSIPGIGIQNRVYTQIPQAAIEAAQKTPELNNLFIPIQNYPTACRMLREQNGFIFNAFKKALSLRGGNSNE